MKTTTWCNLYWLYKEQAGPFSISMGISILYIELDQDGVVFVIFPISIMYLNFGQYEKEVYL